jgi:hypothetical protein
MGNVWNLIIKFISFRDYRLIKISLKVELTIEDLLEKRLFWTINLFPNS